MNIKKSLHEALNGKDKKSVFDMDKLAKYAEAIEVICGGEYGTVFLNEKESKIWIMLGDANPFDQEDLTWFMRDAIKKSYDVKDDEITIEIGDECFPSGEGWKEFKNGKFVDYDGH